MKTAAACLLALVAATQALYGVMAVAGAGALERNVRRIEANPDFGTLYFSLPVWGVLLILIAAAELAAAVVLARRVPYARLYALGATLLGLAIAFFTIALFRGAALLPLALLFVVLYALSYRVSD